MYNVPKTVTLFFKIYFKKGDSGSWETPEQLTFTCFVVMDYSFDVRQYSSLTPQAQGPCGGKLCRISLQSLFFSSFSFPVSLGSL